MVLGCTTYDNAVDCHRSVVSKAAEWWTYSGQWHNAKRAVLYAHRLMSHHIRLAVDCHCSVVSKAAKYGRFTSQGVFNVDNLITYQHLAVLPQETTSGNSASNNADAAQAVKGHPIS